MFWVWEIVWWRSFSENPTASFKRGFDYSYARYGKKARSLKRIGKLLPSPVSHYCKRLGGHFLISFPRMRNTRMCPFSRVCKKRKPLRPASVRSGAMLTIGRRAVEKKYFFFWSSSPISFPKGIIKIFPYPLLHWCIKITRGCNVCGKKPLFLNLAMKMHVMSILIVSHIAYWGNNAPP